MMRFPQAMRAALAGALTLALTGAAAHDAGVAVKPAPCVPVGGWMAPGSDGARRVEGAQLLREASSRQVVLLGETHDSFEHHRWQLQTIAALHALRPDMALGFEMFPRSAQAALDRWVAGHMSEDEFLKDAGWKDFWKTDPQLYMPLFHFARMNRVPMLALNVAAETTRAVREQGFDQVPAAKRENVGRPAPASQAYVEFLLPIYAEHEQRGKGKEDAPKPDSDDPDFRLFVGSQQLWDRAMAEGIAGSLKQHPGRLVVGVMGTGHIADGFGVPHQLRDLGITQLSALVPWDEGRDCARLKTHYADAVFGVSAPHADAPQKPKLGVWLEPHKDGVRIREVMGGSVAEAAGIRQGDLVLEVAGLLAAKPGDVSDAVQRQAPGTWLPLKVRRDGATVEIIAKFPPRQ